MWSEQAYMFNPNKQYWIGDKVENDFGGENMKNKILCFWYGCYAIASMFSNVFAITIVSAQTKWAAWKKEQAITIISDRFQSIIIQFESHLRDAKIQ